MLSRFEKFAEVETIKKLETVYMPKIEKFINYIDHLEKELDDMRSIISQFDVNLSLKASKTVLSQQMKIFEETYMKKGEDWQDIMKKFNEVDFKIQIENDKILDSFS